jgi:hypothetical protein
MLKARCVPGLFREADQPDQTDQRTDGQRRTVEGERGRGLRTRRAG